MPTTANEALRDALIRHQIYLLRYSGFIRNQMVALLDAVEKDLADKIRRTLGDRTGLNSPADVIRMRKLIDAIEQIRREAWGGANKFLYDQMKDLARAEPTFAAGIFTLTSPVVLDVVMPPLRQLDAIVNVNPFQGATLRDWASTMEEQDLRLIRSAVQQGMIAGEDSATIARRAFGSVKLDGTDGATQMTRRQIQAITRTAVQAVANGARDTFFQDNADVIEGEMFVATLDARTTPICRALDGKKFIVGEGPRPPLHFACRSLRIAYFGEDQVGNRPAKSSTRRMLLDEFTEEEGLDGVTDRDELPHGTKGQFDSFERKRVRELTGTVPANVTYNEWLKTQTNSFQDEIMGVTKAKLFRSGLPLDKYVAANGTELTLSQMASKYADAFRQAGLDPAMFN